MISTPEPAIPPAPADPARNSSRGESYIGLGAQIFIFMSMVAFGFAGALLFFRGWEVGPNESIWQLYFPNLLLIGIGVFTALIGVGLLHAAGAASAAVPGPVINPKEWEKISEKVVDGDEDAVTQYIRLRSLGGFSGNFTKLGLTGLPLATIGLTLFFSLMFLHNESYLELAKLTLGAFIGSFVQKQVGERQGAAGGRVKLPTGETVRVQNSATPLV